MEIQLVKSLPNGLGRLAVHRRSQKLELRGCDAVVMALARD